MAREVVTLEIRPTDADVKLVADGDVKGIAEIVIDIIKEFTGDPDVETKVVVKPFIMGMEVLNLMFVRDEGKGSLDDLKVTVGELTGVHSVEVTDQRRTIG